MGSSQILRTTYFIRFSDATISSQMMLEWTMSVQVNKTWNAMQINHNRKEEILNITMKRDLEAMLS